MKNNFKKNIYSIYFKLLLFLVTVVSFSYLVLSLVDIADNKNFSLNILDQNSFYQSGQFINDAVDSIVGYRNMAKLYVNEEHIRAGKSVSLDRIKNLMLSRNHYDYSDSISYKDHPIDYGNLDFGLSKKELLLKEKEIKEEIIKDDLLTFKKIKKSLDSQKGIYLFGSDGRINYGNLEAFNPSDYKAHLKLSDSEILIQPHSYPLMHAINQDMLEPGEEIYLGFTDDYLAPKIKEWHSMRKNSIMALKEIFISLSLLGLAFIGLCLLIGRKAKDDKEQHLSFFDRLFNEFKLLMALALIVIWGSNIFFMDNDYIRIPFTLILASLGLLVVLSLVKDLKYRRFLKNTMFFYLLKIFIDGLKSIYDSSNNGFKVLILVAIYNLIVLASFLIFPLTIFLASIYFIRKIKDYQKIKDGVEQIRAGNLEHKIMLEKEGSLKELADGINTINDGLKSAVDKELKSERLKNELITNISHDIRTPLTSIINYSDLLEDEEDLEKIKDYSRIIQEKSHRLKVLTDDLFDASKINSGNIPVNMERIDIVSLINQSLGEVNGKVLDKNLDFKFSYEEDPLFLAADGELLWRVIDNLLSNIFKYALDSSRVYLDVSKLERDCLIEIKNISASPLNISPDELMERFKRGDESRTSQGSGLGLSIAKSLVEAMGGSFSLKIDGDLFKALISIPLAEN